MAAGGVLEQLEPLCWTRGGGLSFPAGRDGRGALLLPWGAAVAEGGSRLNRLEDTAVPWESSTSYTTLGGRRTRDAHARSLGGAAFSQRRRTSPTLHRLIGSFTCG